MLCPILSLIGSPRRVWRSAPPDPPGTARQQGSASNGKAYWSSRAVRRRACPNRHGLCAWRAARNSYDSGALCRPGWSRRLRKHESSARRALGPRDQDKTARYSGARFYAVGDTDRLLAFAEKVYERRSRAGLAAKTSSVLAISGGGDDGAFGGGLLIGWSERGDRPEFDTVTGISTGALTAPFAFLGSGYDPAIRQVYTNTDADDVFQERNLLAIVASDAMADTTPLRNMIARFVDEKLIVRIAEEYQKGRLLLIMTTNLDQARAVIWNIGAIAESGHPRTRHLIVDILLASASLPGVFPPVMIDITVDGKRYQEMHVDGGAIAQAFLYPPSLSFKKVKELLKAGGLKYKKHKRVAYIIRNGRLYRPEADVERSTLAILTQTTTTMTAASGVNDTYRIYLTTKRDGVGFNLAYIDDDFTPPYKGPFDKGYMRTLFDYGFQKGLAGYPWQNTPPGYQE